MDMFAVVLREMEAVEAEWDGLKPGADKKKVVITALLLANPEMDVGLVSAFIDTAVIIARGAYAIQTNSSVRRCMSRLRC